MKYRVELNSRARINTSCQNIILLFSIYCMVIFIYCIITEKSKVANIKATDECDLFVPFGEIK